MFAERKKKKELKRIVKLIKKENHPIIKSILVNQWHLVQKQPLSPKRKYKTIKWISCKNDKYKNSFGACLEMMLTYWRNK